MSFLQTIRASLFSPGFEESISERKTGFTVRYISTLFVVYAVLMALIYGLFALPPLSHLMEGIGTSFSSLEQLPDDFELSINKGVVRINQPEPFFIPASDALRSAVPESTPRIILNLLVVDSAGEITPERFLEYKSLAWFTKDTFVTAGEDGGIKTESLSSLPDGTIHKEDVLTFGTILSRLSSWLPPLVFGGLFVLHFSALTSGLIYLLPLSFLTIFLLERKGKKVNFWMAYKMTVHAATGAFLFKALAVMLVPVPYMATYGFILLAAIQLFVLLRPRADSLVRN